MGYNEDLERQKKKLAQLEKIGRERARKNAEAKKNASTANDDISPVKQAIVQNAKAKSKANTNSEENESKWFDAGAFSDGYQFGDVSRTILGTVVDVEENVYTAVVDATENLIDTTAYGIGMVGGLFSEDFKEDVGDFIAKDLLHAKEVGEALGKTTPHGLLNWAVNGDTETASVLGDKSDGMVQSAAHLVGQAALQYVGVPWWLTSGVNSFGSEIESAFQQDATYEEAGISGAITAAAEILTEKLSGGIKFGGKAVTDAGLEKITSGISNKLVKSLVKFGWDATGEGAEEIISGYASAIGQKLTYADDKELSELFSSEDAFDAFIGGAILGGGNSAINSVKNVKNGRDPVTALTDNEQKVIDSVYNSRVAEAEKGGKKLTTKEKNEIYDKVEAELKRGEISIDDIESVLGGERYKTYKDTIDSEDAILKEFEELGKKESPTLADQARYAELQEQVTEIKENSKRNDMRMELSKEVFNSFRGKDGRIKDGYLAESYYETSRRGQAFEADLTQYDKEQQEVVKRAIKAGYLNNTRRTHELVDMIAKISADKGVSFDFANNAKLKESGFAVDGKTVNGYYSNGSITLNVESAKTLNTVVGHEVTHVLEGTELYSELQSALFEYAKTKKEYASRRKALEDIYEGVADADIDAELTADLVGDYLFTDPDFINHLSTKNRNVFQKIFDEIKYLCKIATAGSKEARELEKVKKAFEKAYREGGKTDTKSDTKYAVSQVDGIDYVTAEKNIFVKEDGTLASEKEVFDSLVGKKINLPDGEIEIVKNLPDKNMYSELFKRHPKNYGGVEDIKQLNSDVNYNMEELLSNSTPENLNVPDIDNRHSKQGVTSFDTRTVRFYDGNKAYKIDFSIATLKDGKKVAYAKKFFGYDAELTKKIQTAEATGEQSRLNQRSATYSISQNSEKSIGNEKISLSAEQQEYFKDSKVRDENGDLKVMYHGTSKGGHTVFDTYGSNYGLFGQGSYFTDNKEVAESYTKKGKGNNPQVYESYLNITNPMDMDAEADPQAWAKAFPDADFPESGTNEDFYRAMEEYFADEQYPKWEAAEEAMNALIGMGYDGITHIGGGRFNKADDTRHQVYIAFHSEQIKNIDNEKPTDNPDIRYSLSTDNEGTKLTKEQSDFFKDSKMRDDNGNLLVMYHGSQDAGFHEFEQLFSDDGTSFFFVDRNTVAKSYSGTNETYTARTFRTAEDFNRFFAEIGMDEYSVTEEMHGDYKWFVLREDGDEVASSETAKMLYDEFRDWTGLGTGSANYKVYLNLKNPLVVDAQNSEWDEIAPVKGETTMTTREYARYAKENGYDGVIFKNIIDNGAYASGSDRFEPSTVAIAFESNQIKSVANEKPTEKADIRYSLSEYTEDEKKAHNKAVLDHFGKTYSWNETGYLLLDGTRLDLSGKHDGAPGGYRTVDHRDITEALGYDYGGGDWSGSLIQFMSEGNIRIIPECNGINLSVKPNKAQEQALANYISRYRGEVLLDIDDLNGNTVVSVEYPYGTYYTKVLNDIREWFENGKKPETSGSYSLTKNGETPKTYGKWNIHGKDIRLENKTETKAEDIAPIAEREVVDFPDDPNLYDLEEETNRQRESLASLTDEDAPPEIEAPYYDPDDSGEIDAIDPFNDRELKTVGNQKIKAYMYENPEVKSFFQEEAEILLGELQQTEKPETIYNGWLKYDMNYEAAQDIPEVYRTPRITTESIAYLRDSIGMSYADIEKGLNAIIEDNGAENIAAAKKIEFEINNRLLYGYNTWDMAVPRNEAYVRLLKEKNITEYNEEARKKFFEDVEGYAPMAEDDIAPTKEYEAIKPRPERLTGEEAQWAKNKMSRADKVNDDEQQTAKILVNEPETAKKKGRGLSKFVQNFVDKQSVFETLSLKTKNRELMAKADQMHRAESSAQWLIGNGTAGVKSLDDIRAEVENTGLTEQFYEYMYHKHNIDRMNLESRYKDTKNKPVFGNNVTAEKSQEIVNQYEFAEPMFKEYAKDIYGYMNHLRKKLVDNGVISQETADLWAEMYPHYVPIRRVGDSGLNVNVPLDTGRTGINAPIKRATGGSRDILPLFDTMAMRTQQTYKAIARNSFGVELKNTLGSTIESNAANLDEVIDSIDKHEELLQKGENGRNPTFTVFENGERVTFEITEEMYDALKPTSEFFASKNKVLNTVSNIRRGLITEYNPVFLATNAIKDVQDVLINSQHATTTYKNIPKALYELVTKGRWYQEYMENGGEDNTYFEGESNTFTKDDTGIKKAIGIPLRGISKANNFIERAPRLAEYIASREAGASVEVAMLDSARVTTNFAAGGDVTKFLDRNGATFLNASVQGMAQQVRNVREAKANGLKGWLGLAGKFALAGLPAMILNHLLWDDDEDYAELSDYVKDNYYIVAKYGDGQFVRIPKGRTVAVIQKAFNEVGNALTGNDDVDFQSFFELFMNNIAPNNPIDNNIFSPIIQVANNKTWYGEDLVPSRLQDLPVEEQYDESTDSLSRWLGETFGWSPYKVNYLLDQYSGGIGDVVLPMMTPEAESGDDSLLGNIIAPFKDKFTTDSVMNNQNVSDFYDTKDELATLAKSSDATDEDLLRYKYMNSVSSDLGELYAKKREIQNSDLNDSEKYEYVREIQKQIDAIAKESLSAYQDVYIEGGYAIVGDRYYKRNTKGEWEKISDNQLDVQEEVTSALGISGAEYWRNKSEYDFAYEYPEKYAVAKSVGGYEKYRAFASDVSDLKADKDANGKTISGSRKKKVIEYINSLDADYGEKIIMFKSVYNADDTYNSDIVEYLNGREDISYEEMVSILKELGFTVHSDGRVTW